MYGYPGAGYAEVGAIGGVPVGTVGNPEPSRYPELGSLSAEGVPPDVMRADQATVDGRTG